MPIKSKSPTLKAQMSLVNTPVVPTKEAEAKNTSLNTEVIASISRLINQVMAAPSPRALLACEASSVTDQRVVKPLLDIQYWLQESVIERDDQTGGVKTPSTQAFSDRLTDLCASMQTRVQSLSEISVQIETFFAHLRHWLNGLVGAAPQEGNDSESIFQAFVPAGLDAEARFELNPHAIDFFKECGVQVTKDKVSEIEGVLVLAAVAQSLERRWISISIEYLVAYLSSQRGRLIGVIADSLSERAGQLQQGFGCEFGQGISQTDLEMLERLQTDVFGFVQAPTRSH